MSFPSLVRKGNKFSERLRGSSQKTAMMINEKVDAKYAGKLIVARDGLQRGAA